MSPPSQSAISTSAQAQAVRTQLIATVATSFLYELSAGLPVQLLANRPDVRAAEMELARTHYAVGVARTSFFPSLTLGGTVGFTNN